jgi:hypothetical protein
MWIVMPKKKFSIQRVARVIVPPVLAIGASASILLEASWLHHRETHPATTPGSSVSTGVNVPNLSGFKQHRTSQAGAQAPATSHPTSQKHTTQSKASNNTQGKQNGSQNKSDTETQAATGDQGFSPVSGGTVQDARDPSKLNLATAMSSLVVQYGSSPQTTFDGTSLSSQYGIHVTLNLPKNVTANQILLLPLTDGVIWAVVPTASTGSDGLLTASSQPSDIYYTPYGGSDPSKVTLSPGAESLGEIPVTTESSRITTSWYAPHANSTKSDSGSSVSNGASNVTDAPETADDVKPQSTNGQTQIRTIADTSGINLYLRGLYKVDNGVVIVLRTQQGSASGQWAYAWNESTKSLKPVCSIVNSGSDFGWIAVGQHTVFWGQRSLIPPDDTYYKGTQYMMTLATGAKHRIGLGDWTSEAVAGQNIDTYHSDPDQADDELYFRVNDSPLWQEFIPSAGQ